MKQKVLIKVTTKHQEKILCYPFGDNKYQSKAMKIAVGVPGVEAAAIKGDNKDEIEVVGEGIDAVNLTTLLRKKMGYASLVSVGPEKKEDKDKDKDKDKDQTKLLHPFVYAYPHIPTYNDSYHEPMCTIL